MKIIITTLLISVSLIACTSVTRAPNLSPDTHSLTVGTVEGGEKAAQNRAVQKAKKYCEAMKKELQVIDFQPVSQNMLSVGSVKITFRCFSPGDMEKSGSDSN